MNTMPQQVLAEGREVAFLATHAAASKVSLGLCKSQSHTKRSLTCFEQSYKFNFCYLSCKTIRPLPDYQLLVTNNPMGYLLPRTRFRNQKMIFLKQIVLL